MHGHETKINESLANESNGSDIESIDTKPSSPGNDLESSYCSIDDLLSIETFMYNDCTQAENSNDADHKFTEVDVNLNGVSNGVSCEKVIDTQTNSNTISPINRLIVISELHKLIVISNLVLVPDKKTAIVKPVENNSGSQKENITDTTEILPSTNPPITHDSPLDLRICPVSNVEHTKVKNKIEGQCNEIGGANSSSSNATNNLNQAIFSGVASKLKKEDLIAQAEKFISDVVLALKEKDLKMKTENKIEHQSSESTTNLGVELSNNDSLFSDGTLTLTDREFILQVECQIDAQIDKSTSVKTNPDINPSADSNEPASNKVASISKEEDSIGGVKNEIGNKEKESQCDQKIYNKANVMHDNKTCRDLSTSPSGVLNLKIKTPKSDVGADSKEILRVKNEYKNYTQYIKIRCSKCGLAPWNARFKLNPKCKSCDQPTSLRCSKCSKEYSKYMSIIDHLRYRCVPINALYKCAECEYATNAKTAFKKHLITHKTSESVECPDCGKSYKNDRYLREHMQFYCPNKTLLMVACSDCGREFKNERYLQLHKRHHCQSEMPSNEKQLKCPNCERRYKSLKGLRNHQRYYCQNGENVEEVKCPNCQKSFQNELHLKRHQKQSCSNVGNAEKAKCPSCGKTYENEMRVKKHQKYYCKKEPIVRKVKCPDCNKELCNMISLRKHRKIVHNVK